MTSVAEIAPALERLLEEASYGQLATLMPEGAHLTQVWLTTEAADEHIDRRAKRYSEPTATRSGERLSSASWFENPAADHPHDRAGLID